MRRYLKKQISEIVDTMLQAADIIKHSIKSKKINSADVLLKDVSAGIDDVLRIVSDRSEEVNAYLETLCICRKTAEMCVYEKDLKKKLSICDVLKKQLLKSQNVLCSNVSDDKLKVVFMPYKADMWTSMMTIWEAAMEDEECEVGVVPMPYFDITNPKNITFHYEAERFPNEVKCIHYNDYSEAKEHPDVIVIHNPYDDKNNVTRVPERFYSSVLKMHTDKLIYSPYHTINFFSVERQLSLVATPANLNADYIICQSDRLKQIYENLGFPSEKLLSFGSPKIDVVVKCSITKEDIPVEWKEKIQNKKVFLLNTHLSYFATSFLNKEKLGDYAVRFHEEIAQAFLNRDDCALIWRPHPLLKNMLQGRFPQCMEYVNDFARRVQEAGNGIIDDTGNYLYSFVCSDALLSTWSSLINEYMITQKPILIFQTRASEDAASRAPINCNVNYFRFGQGGMTFQRFRDNVITGTDDKYDARLHEIGQAFPNMNGDAGQKIYEYLKQH